eukprot:4180563-Prymnesium_polylepis.1
MRLLHRLETAQLTGASASSEPHPQSWRPPRHPDVKGLEAFWSREIEGPSGTAGEAGAPPATDRSAGSTQSAGDWPDELVL